MATNAPGSIGFLSPLTFPDIPLSLSFSLPPCSWPYTSKPGSGILGTFFHVKQRGSVQGCDATALFPLRGEEPCAVRPIPVRSKKTATFSHRFPSSARQLKTIPECLWVRGTATQAREQANRGRGRCRKMKLKEEEKEVFFLLVYPDCLWAIENKQRGEKKSHCAQLTLAKTNGGLTLYHSKWA